MEFVIPSMWRKSKFTLDALEYYLSIDKITKIIIIDNDFSRRPDSRILKSNKIKIINYGRNIYVNAAWNKGMENASDDLVCICNDDIRVDELAISLVSEFESINPDAVDLIGVSKDSKTKCFGISPFKIDIKKNLGMQAGGLFGVAMFIRKKKYKKIPQDLKVWFGDDFLAHSYKNVYTISPIKFSGAMGSTITSMRNEGEDIDEIIKVDIEIWKKKYLKIFSKKGLS